MKTGNDRAVGGDTIRVAVDLGERSYPILIGADLLSGIGGRVRDLRPGARCAIVSDETVAALHGGTVRDSLAAAGVEFVEITVPAGEKSKSHRVLEGVLSQLLDARLERSDLVLALGGGVVGDLAGFAAAIYKRGMDFIQLPTTLLAQVDSSVGGKTGINAAQGKNLIGSFHQPILVLADTGVLKTLSKREFAAGYAEVAKYGLIDDAAFFSWLEAKREEIFAHGPALAEAIAASCRAKARIVSMDEREGSVRALLNLGHTFGHALEGFVQYDASRLIHGEAVAIGMAQAHRFSNRMNLASGDDAARVEAHLVAAGLPVTVGAIPGDAPEAAALFDFITQDKKVSGGKLTFILTKGIGRSYIARDVPPDEVKAFLEEDCRR
ncbi:MAG: 3-dehydroquinate synthase [Nitratireductor sp.]|nr:3-dehydroquinate synthase [Nitratireductor sp.]